jgi:hypothetical protein
MNNSNKATFWYMYLASCTFYYPEQQMHNIYILIHIYILTILLIYIYILTMVLYRKYSTCFDAWIWLPKDDADASKHAGVLTLYKILLMYIFMYMLCICCLDNKEINS